MVRKRPIDDANSATIEICSRQVSLVDSRAKEKGAALVLNGNIDALRKETM